MDCHIHTGFPRWIAASIAPPGQLGAMDSGGHTVAGGHWDFAAIPTKDKLESEPGALSSVPGSRTMWAMGFLINGSIPELGEVIGFGR